MLLVAGGTIGYHTIEGWSWFNALYASVITLTSIGYEGKHALSEPGRVFTMVLAVGGIFTVAAAAAEILGIVVTGELRRFRKERRMRKRIDALEGHVIVCGHGQVGQHVSRELREGGVPFVVVDPRDDALAAALALGGYALRGDATADPVLHRAGIERARALIASAGSDPENVLITMTARLLAPALPIVARAEDEATVPKLLRAGATRTIAPHAVAGGRLVPAALHPAVLDLLDAATSRLYSDLQMEQQLVEPGGPLDGKTVGTSGLRSGLRRLVVAIKHPGGGLAFNPGNDVPVAAGDVLITLTVAGETLARIDPRHGRWFRSRAPVPATNPRGR